RPVSCRCLHVRRQDHSGTPASGGITAMLLRGPNAAEAARQARRSIILVRNKLLNPTAKALDACTPHLRNAIESLGRLEQQLDTLETRSPGDRNLLRMELSELRWELSQVNALMQNACKFHTTMAYLLAPKEDDSVNYIPT